MNMENKYGEQKPDFKTFLVHFTTIPKVHSVTKSLLSGSNAVAEVSDVVETRKQRRGSVGEYADLAEKEWG